MTLPFKKHYPKLEQLVFPTIRRRWPTERYGEVGEIVEVSVAKEPYGRAMLIDVGERTLTEMPDRFLQYDTDSDSREEAEEYIQAFYRKPVDRQDEELFVLWYRWEEWYDE